MDQPTSGFWSYVYARLKLLFMTTIDAFPFKITVNYRHGTMVMSVMAQWSCRSWHNGHVGHGITVMSVMAKWSCQSRYNGHASHGIMVMPVTV